MTHVYASVNWSIIGWCNGLLPNQNLNQCWIIVNSLRPRQNGRHFADNTFKRLFQNENVWISIKISLKFVPKAPINNIPSLVQIMAWRRPGGKPLSEPMMVSLLTHICVTLPQWVKWALGNGISMKFEPKFNTFIQENKFEICKMAVVCLNLNVLMC